MSKSSAAMGSARAQSGILSLDEIISAVSHGPTDWLSIGHALI